jgi:hypothetical protein
VLIDNTWDQGQWITGNILEIQHEGTLWVYILDGKHYQFTDTRRVPLTGASGKILLATRVVAAAEESADATVDDDYADDAMKTLVTNAFSDPASGNYAPTEGTRVLSNFSVAADNSAGEKVTLGVSGNLLTFDGRRGALVDIMDASREAGTPVYHDVIPTINRGSISWTYQTYTGQPGRPSAKRVWFVAGDNFQDSDIKFDRRKEITCVYVRGKGEDDTETVTQVYSSYRMKASIYNRREAIVKAYNAEDADLTSIGEEYLSKHRPVQSGSGKIVDNDATRFGYEWDFGDRVRVVDGAYTNEGIVSSVVMTATPDKGVEVYGKVTIE